jgi:uncharacterized protein (TIGR02001 family)
MKKLSYLLILSGLVSVSAIAADSPHSVSGNIAFTTDYIFRGVSQTQNGPALQGGFDYSHASGLYLGTWGSNVDWVSAGTFKNDSSMEIDLYGGYKGTVGPIGYDVGLITYYYPGDKISGTATPDTTEVYVGGSWEFLSLKYSHVVSKNFIGWVNTITGEKSRNSSYIELNANYALENGWALIGHIGSQKVKNLSGADYTDWKVGVSKDIGYGVVTLAYSDTDADVPGFYTLGGEEIADGRAYSSFSKSF